MKLSPYLFFTTRCEDALTYYQSCGIGKMTVLLRYGDNGMSVRTESFRGKIMHSRFEGPGILFFASDNDDAEPMKGGALLLELQDIVFAQELFKKFASGGLITVPLSMRPWGGHFGMVVDQFGVQWMFNC
jgi:PhnB protein